MLLCAGLCVSPVEGQQRWPQARTLLLGSLAPVELPSQRCWLEMSEGQCYCPRCLCAWGLAAIGAQREPGTMALLELGDQGHPGRGAFLLTGSCSAVPS